MVTAYLASTVNRATNNETANITDAIYLAHDTVMEREERLRRREQYHAKRSRKTAEERESRLQARRANKRRENAMMSTKQ